MAKVLQFPTKDKNPMYITLVSEARNVKIEVPSGFDEVLVCSKESPFFLMAMSIDNKVIGYSRELYLWEDAMPYLRTLNLANEEGLI